MTIKIDTNQQAFLWECKVIDKNHIIIQKKKYYKHNDFYACLANIFISLIVLVLFPNIFTYIIFFFFLITCVAIIIFVVIKSIKLFREFELRFNGKNLLINNCKVINVCIFCVCDPDNYELDPSESNGGHNNLRILSPITGFQFTTETDVYYASTFFSEKHNNELWDIFDFLNNNKIKFSYKYKIIDYKMTSVVNRFRFFETEFGLESFNPEETAVEGSFRYISKEGKKTFKLS